MPLVEWKQSFEVGLPAVDYEHRQMVDLLNEMYDGLREGIEEDRALEFFAEVHAKIAAHFALEERLMAEVQYALFEDHKADHEDLLDQINDIMEDYEKGDYEDHLDKLSVDLEAWFIVHFREKDAILHHAIGR
jgi:hemerythrin